MAELGSAGLAAFCAGLADEAARLLERDYRQAPQALALLVNLGLVLAQRGQPEQAARCYTLALASADPAVQRAAHKNLGLLRLWQGRWHDGWNHYRRRHAGLGCRAWEWQGQPLNGHTLTVWNDLGMGDAMHFVRYTLPLLERGERLRLAVDASQVELFQRRLAWPLAEVVDRQRVNLEAGPHIPLIHLLPLLDPELQWGARWAGPTFLQEPTGETPTGRAMVGLCWASNPSDPTMAPYKSCPPERLLVLAPGEATLSLQTDEAEAHGRLGLAPAQRNWLHTLAQLGRCRRVISVDTAVAHLAAGSGIPVQMLLGPVPDWRWRHLGPSPWYPGLSLLPLDPEDPADPAAPTAPAAAPYSPSS